MSATVIAPQAGPQTAFLATDVDVAVYGGAAGGGKSWALLLDALYFAALKPVPDFGAVIFRRTSPQITQQGGLWDESGKLYPFAGGTPKQDPLQWVWPQFRTRVRFAHMQYESDRFNWQGSQIPYIAFDELTHFTEGQFFYMLSRNRSICGVKPRMRATTNPDADSWVKVFLAPWVDDAYPDPAQSGEVRWFYRDAGQLLWLRHPDQRPAHVAEDHLKSGTFIAATLTDNPKLMAADPSYKANLLALPLVERERLLAGSWSIRPSGNLFKRHWFKIIDAAPTTAVETVRRWDLASTEPRKGATDPDWTCGVKMCRTAEGAFCILDVIFIRETPGAVKALVKQTAELDGRRVTIRFAQDPGQAGKAQLHDYVTLLNGFPVGGEPETGDKVTRAGPFSSQCEAGNVSLVHGPWIEQYLNQLTAFPVPQIHDDAVDASSGAHAWLSRSALSAASLLDHLTARHEDRGRYLDDYPETIQRRD